MSPYANQWQAVKARIATAALQEGRNPGEVALLVVSKTFAADAVRAVHGLGQRTFGENYVQEALAKMESLADLPDLEWHLIGPLQSNKARAVAGVFSWVHTIDRLRLAQRLSDVRPASLAPLQVCVQVNVSAEASKHGVAPEAALALAREVAALPRLELRGFMTIAEESGDLMRQRSQFRRLAALLAEANAAGLALDTLSMGMSGDLEAAIAEGATMVRVGSAIFGARPRSHMEEGIPASSASAAPPGKANAERDNLDTATRDAVIAQARSPQR